MAKLPFDRMSGRPDLETPRDVTSRPSPEVVEELLKQTEKADEVEQDNTPLNVYEPVQEEVPEVIEPEKEIPEIVEPKVEVKEQLTEETIEEVELIVPRQRNVRITAYTHARLGSLVDALGVSSYNNAIEHLLEIAEGEYLTGAAKQIYDLKQQSVNEEYEKNNWDKQLD